MLFSKVMNQGYSKRVTRDDLIRLAYGSEDFLEPNTVSCHLSRGGGFFREALRISLLGDLTFLASEMHPMHARTLKHTMVVHSLSSTLVYLARNYEAVISHRCTDPSSHEYVSIEVDRL